MEAKQSRTSLFQILLGSHLALVGVMIVGFALAFLWISYHSIYERAESELLGAAEALTEQLRKGSPLNALEIPDVFVHRFGKAPRDRAYWGVWNQAEQLVGSGGEMIGPLKLPHKRPSHTGPKQFESRTEGKRLEVFTNLDDGGILVIGRPLSKEFDSLGRIALRLIGVGIVGFLLTATLAWWIAQKVANPISDLAMRVRSINEQQMSTRLDTSQPTKEMSALAGAFNSMMQSLQTSFQRQQQFTSDAAHELRTPVSIILSQSEFSLFRDRSVEEYRQGFDTCRRTAIHMKRLVDELLEICRLDAGKVETEFAPVRLDTLAEETVQLLKPVATERNIQLQCLTTPVSILGSTTKLRRIILNLMANALEHSPSGSVVLVKVDQQIDQAQLQVIDRGSGIAAEDLPLVWDRFYRGDKARTHGDQSGSGLGLSLVAELVKLHDGSCKILSTVGEGTTVQVFLPRIRNSEEDLIGEEPLG
jgi:signal transduction histidine kinase